MCDTYDTDERCKSISLFVIFPLLLRCHAELLDARDGDEQRVARVNLEESVSHLVESDRLFPLELWKRKRGEEERSRVSGFRSLCTTITCQ